VGLQRNIDTIRIAPGGGMGTVGVLVDLPVRAVTCHNMYMGGNGFFWVISYHPEKPWVMEVRKGESGSRAWQAAPGETLHSTTGEKGGLPVAQPGEGAAEAVRYCFT
jgi:hypothetical protein